MTRIGPVAEATAAAVAAGEAGPARRVVQLPLFAGEVAAGEAAAGPEGKRGPGRPKGARNKATAAWTEFILASGPSPLQFLAEVYRRPTYELAAALGCKLVEAMEIQIRAATQLAPYLHQRQPQALQVDGAGPALVLTVNLGAEPSQAVSGDEVLRLAGEIVENQQVIDVDPAASEDAASEDPKNDEKSTP